MDQPAWLAAAWAEFGVRETPGADDTAEILRYFREAGDTSAESEATPWCAAFAGAMLKRGGHAGTGSLLARSYLDWGIALDAPRLGAVTVLSPGDDPNAGHVGFLLSESGGKIYLLGGNQGDAVTVAGFDKARLLGLRWPNEEAEAAMTGGSKWKAAIPTIRTILAARPIAASRSTSMRRSRAKRSKPVHGHG
jgi:uncharacterized protein (TIGR02594 family)